MNSQVLNGNGKSNYSTTSYSDYMPDIINDSEETYLDYEQIYPQSRETKEYKQRLIRLFEAYILETGNINLLPLQLKNLIDKLQTADNSDEFSLEELHNEINNSSSQNLQNSSSSLQEIKSKLNQLFGEIKYDFGYFQQLYNHQENEQQLIQNCKNKINQLSAMLENFKNIWRKNKFLLTKQSQRDSKNLLDSLTLYNKSLQQDINNLPKYILSEKLTKKEVFFKRLNKSLNTLMNSSNDLINLIETNVKYKLE